MQTLLTVPITIREQIYHELLTYIPSETATKDVAPSSPICKLLTLNRQINTEVLKFLSSQLCVVVKTNYSRFGNSILDEQVYHLPLISQLQSRSGAIKKDCSRFPVAMEWDSCVFRSRLLAESTPYCLMPATSMMQFTQIARKRSASLLDTSLTFTLLETFSYSKDRALEILVGPWLENPILRQKFLAVSTNDAIPPLLTADLREHWQRQGSAGYYLLKIDMFRRNVNSDTPENTVIQYKMVCKYARLVYDCQLDCIRSNYGGFLSPSTEDTVLMLWSATCTTAADLVEVLCHLAGTFGPKGLEVADASDSVALLQEARKVAEEMISFLSDKPFCAQEESMTSDAVQIPVRKQKFLMSFKAHIVCKALGDVDAAIGYLEDATKYYSESPENPVEKLHELRAERGTGNEGSVPRVVRWTS